ncbi:MAG TPA: isocitrate/isopropylmalate family dehydrogenase, partial [Acidimicrobiia bacterium]
MSTYSIALVPGDGTGPEVVREAVKVLAVAGAVHGFELDYSRLDLGGERYLRTGETLTGADVETLTLADAILFGAVGHPQVPPGVLEQEILLRMRREFDQFINLRPVKLHPGVKGPLR